MKSLMAIAFSNLYAPEHLIINVKDAEKWESFVENAGSVFMGQWTPESVGDYASGTNHVLPTYGYARMYGGVCLDSFLKYITVQSLTEEGLKKLGPYVATMAEIEGLDAHKRAVTLRLQDIEARQVSNLKTRVAEERAISISTRLGFSGVCRAPTVGGSGGIWMLWRQEEVKVDVIDMDQQAIHAVIAPKLGQDWLCSGVYAKPNPSERESFWNKLESMSTANSLPWLVTGDFNEVANISEKRGRRLASAARCRRFKEMMDTCGFMDLGYRGPKFTWFNSSNGLACVRERLDRSIANVAWQECFPESLVLHLPRTHSDHHPLLTLCNGLDRPRARRPFRFELAWFTDPQCKEIVEQVWNSTNSIYEAIDQLPKMLKEWNKCSFGNIFFRKRRILARLNGIQKRLCCEENQYLSDLEDELIGDYNLILKQEELLWFQKSRVKWLVEGDRNTKFYHMTTVCRRRNNKVVALKIDGEWQTDDAILRDHVRGYFLQLFQQHNMNESAPLPLPNHLMQSMWLPSSTCKQLDRMNRDFLWASDPTHRKLHLVGWKKVTRPKMEGGLGLRPSRETNIALLSKVGWKTLKGENELWGATFRHKYIKNGNFLNYKPKGSDSATFKGIAKSLEAVQAGIKWRVVNGQKISLWFDRWAVKDPLCNLVEGDIRGEETDWSVAEILGNDGQWLVEKIKTKLPPVAIEAIHNTPIPWQRDKEDKIIWGGTSNGIFSCKSAYHCIKREDLDSTICNKKWKWIWKIKAPYIIQHFIWLCAHESIVTNALRKKRKLTDSDLCPRCHSFEETIIHTLRDCTWAKRIWEFLITPTQFLSFMNLPPSSWLHDNLTGMSFNNIIYPNISWDRLFAATVWAIWKSRNSAVFANKVEHTREIVFTIKKMVMDFEHAFPGKKLISKATTVQADWVKPDKGWFKVNTDGSVLVEKKSAAAGGVIRDDEGVWILGFSRNLGDVTITVAELLAAREGLSLAWERRLPCIILELDSEVVVKLIRRADTSQHPLGAVIEDCRRLLGMPWESKIVHTKRSGNACADALAKLGHSIGREGHSWDSPPHEVLQIFLGGR
ncbi:hypothetical protein RD792_015838 [Penstemon davidsonii]|uniref:RNase H type-1 domain-containing protein n=1 Tax=Penstemon davidsonii TaxID=160366 RepID=A0ABR0CKD3_9LAMI|nr:hypothetical protein RD792_015838 [Penstemon davidsonii]